MTQFFPRRTGSLEAIFAFTRETLRQLGVNPSQEFRVNLILEELFTNMVKYSRESDRDVRVEIDARKDALVLSLTDFDVEPFDITRAPEVDVDQPLAERRPGGLGIHLVKQMAESITYEYRDRTSKTTLTLALET
jgi:anti-sigma regulatory factor (Ser/Thr protein kinase)